MYTLGIPKRDYRRTTQVLGHETQPPISYHENLQDDGFYMFTFPEAGSEDDFRYIVEKLKGEGIRVIGADSQLTEKQIMKLANLIEISEDNTSKFQVGDIVVPNTGAHKGVKHTVIHDFRDGRYNIQPIGLRPNQIQYRLGAASANEDQLKKVSSGLQQVAPSIMDTSGMSTADIAKALGDMTKKKGLRPNEDIGEGTCGYSIDGKPANKPAGPHLIRKAIREEIKKLNEADFKNIQSIIDGNQFVNGTANEESIIETDKHILFISPEGLKHIKERHSDRSKPGSIITGDLKDIITKTIRKSPSESSGGRVKWLDVKVGNVGEMGVAKATPEEVSGMTDYTMPDGRKETIKIKQGQRPKTDVFNVITAEIGEDSGKPVLSVITAFPGPNSIDGVEMPMDRNEFAEKGFYFIVNKKLDENIKPSKEMLRMKKLAGLITESEIKNILKN